MSDNTEKLQKLVELSAVFKNAVEAGVDGNVELQQKALASLKTGEMEEMQELLNEVIAGGLSAAFGGVTEEFLKLNLKLVDVSADITGRVMSEDELAAFLPEDMKSQDIADQLRAEGAEHVAKVVEYALK